MNGIGGVREELLDGDKAGAAVSGFDDESGIHALLDGPIGPGAGHGGGGIDEDAVHIEEQGRAEDTSHWAPENRNRYCRVKAGGGEGQGVSHAYLFHTLSHDKDMKKEVNICGAKAGWSRLLRRLAAGEEITITNRGVPVARLVPVFTSKPKRKG